MAKIRLKRILHEIHTRSVWQVLSVYVAGSWGVLQAVEMVQGTTGLPDWILPAALVLLLIGLPIVLATAVVQGGPHLPGHQDPTPTGRATAATADGGGPKTPGDESPTRFFTWRNTLLGGTGAAVVWVLIAAGWFARDYLSGGAAGEAADLHIPLASAAEPGAGAAGPLAGGEQLGEDDADREERREGAATDTLGGVEEGAGGVAGRTPPAPPPAAPPTPETAEDRGAAADRRAADAGPSRAEIERARTVFQTARVGADSARGRAGRLSASETAPAVLARADSSWNAGDAAAAAGRYAEATRLMRSAGDRFGEAEREARAVWRERIGTALATLPALRDAAEPSEARFASAGERVREGERLRDADDLPGAVAAFSEAAELYRAIPRPAAGPEAATPSEGEPPDAPAPREVVEATLGELSRALAAEDLSRVRSVWVSLTEEQASNFSTFFRRWDHIDVRFDPDWASLDAAPGELTVTVYTTWRFMEGGEAQEQPPFAQTFQLIERDSRWVILDR